MNDVQLLLLAAKTLISYEEDWTQGHAARKSNGTQALAESDKAVRWCALGALKAVGADYRAQRFLDEASTIGNAIRTNDDLGHAAVMAMYDRAIELAGEET